MAIRIPYICSTNTLARHLSFGSLIVTLIDHSILVNELHTLDVPRNRFQTVKQGQGCYSEWGSVPCGVPQETKLVSYLFIIMLNYLKINDASLEKFVDDTTASEVIFNEQETKHKISSIDCLSGPIKIESNSNQTIGFYNLTWVLQDDLFRSMFSSLSMLHYAVPVYSGESVINHMSKFRI